MGQNNSKKINKLFIQLINELSFYNLNLFIKLQAIELFEKYQVGSLKYEEIEELLANMKDPPYYLSKESIIRCRKITKKILHNFETI